MSKTKVIVIANQKSVVGKTRGVTMSKAKVIAIANQKGGVGKTTTSVNLAAYLKDMGYKTLLIDTDGQCNSTDTCQAVVENQATMFDLLFTDEPARNCVQETDITEMIASDPNLNDSERRFPNDGSRLFLMKEKSEELLDLYDFIIIDTPPSLGCMLGNILTFSDYVIIPVTCDRYGMMGINELYNTIISCKKYTNRELKVLGVVLIKYHERTVLCKELTAQLPDVLKNLDTRLFDTKIRESEACRKAQSSHQSILTYAPNSTTGIDYKAFAKEILEETTKKGE